MTTFLKGKAGGLEPISKIAKIPDLVEDKIIMATCHHCCNPVSIKESEAYVFEISCESCKTAMKNISKQEQRNRDINKLGGLKAYDQFTFDKFTNKAAVKLCANFPAINLFLWGPAGTGKTHLATATIRELAGTVVKPQHIYRQCRGLKDGVEEQAAIDSFINTPFLVIDDLGVDKKTDWSFSTLYEVIDGRDMAERKGLIVTSNLSLTALAERLGDDRISSRLAGMCKIIEMTGKDMRGIKGEK